MRSITEFAKSLVRRFRVPRPRLRRKPTFRVRHPAAPDLFVWYVKRNDRIQTSLGECMGMEIHFASVRAGMTLEEAKEMADLCGGIVEST